MASSTKESVYHDFIDSIRYELQKAGVIDRVEYIGSRYKGTSVGSSDYDNVFIKRDPSIRAETSQTYPNFAYLTRNGQRINRADRMQEFKRAIQNALRATGESSYATITAAHEPTAVVKYDRPEKGSFSVDMVYGLEVDDQIYVGRSPESAAACETNLWYKDVALEDKKTMKPIEDIGKEVVRRLKKLKDVEPSMQPLKSCAFENALMYLKDSRRSDFWRGGNIQAILCAVLKFMEEKLREGHLWAYNDRNDDVIRNLTPTQRDQLANRFRNLHANPDIIQKKISLA